MGLEVFLTAVVVGLLTGRLAGIVMKDGGHGLVPDLVLGLTGSNAAVGISSILGLSWGTEAVATTVVATGMRVVQVAPWFHPHLGGVETHVRALAGELARRGHEVTVLTTRHDPSLLATESLDGFTVHRLKPVGVWFQTPIVPSTKRMLAGLRADVVHAHSPPPLSAYYAAKANRGAGAPFVITYHCDIELRVPGGGLIEAIYRRSLGASTIRRADRVIVTTHSYAATSRAVWRYNPSVIPNFVDADRFHPNGRAERVRAKHAISPGEPIVLAVCRLVPHKGLEHLVEAAGHVDGARFVIAGESRPAPLATVRMAARSCSGGSSLSTKPLAPARSAS